MHALRWHRTRSDRSRPTTGFTLIELLVVIGIIAVLAMMLLPAIGTVKKSAQSIKCLSNLRQIGMGMQGYMQDFDGQLPTVSGGGTEWLTLTSPYVEADKWSGNTPGWGQYDSRSVLVGCPLYKKSNGPNRGYAMSTYLGGGWGSATYGRITYKPNRILVGERDGDHMLNGLGVVDFSRHKPLTNALMCDMHVQSLTYQQTNWALNNPAAFK